MKRTRLLVLILVATVAVAALGLTNAHASLPTACGDCHAKYPDDHFDQFSDATPVSLARCWPCHGNQINHGTARINTPWGAFASVDSTDLSNSTTIATIHSKHKNTNRWSVTNVCINCHGGASCLACHPNPVDEHADHPARADGSTDYPGVRETYSTGSRGMTAPYRFDATLTCTNVSCHGSMNIAFFARPSCLNCHSVNKSGHGDLGERHRSDEATATCVASGCHFSVNAVDEHESRSLTCTTCHNNPDPDRAAVLRAAIEGGNPNCSACHTLAAEPHHDFHEYAGFNAGCRLSGCHQNYLEMEHAARGYRCQICHANPDPQRAAACQAAITGHDRRCSACHGQTGEIGHDAIHEANPRIDDPTNPYGDFCFACHSNNLMYEHPRHRAASGAYMGCHTCHSVQSGPVADAIAAGDTSCDACHPIHGDVVSIHESPTTQRGNVIDGLECNECHKSNIASEHGAHGYRCSTCHDSANATILGAIDAADTACTACHPAYHAGDGGLAGTFTLNGGDDFTTTTTVSAQSVVPGATKMRLAKDAVWGAWMDYADTVQITLSSADGTKTVRAQYKDDAKHFLDTSDTILLDTMPPSAPGAFTVTNGQTTALVSWSNPTDPDFAKTCVLRSTSGFAAAVGGGAGQTQVYEGTDTGLTDTDVLVGAGYYYTAFSCDAVGNWSVRATASVRVRQITALAWDNASSVASVTVDYGGVVRLVAALSTDAGAVPGQACALYRSADGLTWTRTGSVYCNATTGLYETTRALTANTYFKMRFPGDATRTDAQTAPILAKAKALLSTPDTPSMVARGTYFTITGYLKPRHTGSTKIELFRFIDGRTQFYAYRWATNSDYSTYTKYTLTYRISGLGGWGVVAHHSDADHATSWSGARYFEVR